MIVYGEGERYVVSAVTGYSIGASRGHSSKASVSYAVLDSDYGYRAVDSWLPKREDRSARVRHAAFTLCDRLNGEHCGRVA